MNTFDESSVNRKTSAGARGQFDNKLNSEPDVALNAAPSTDEHLDSALAVWGLTADDLPGIETAWNERFAPLDGEWPETVESTARSVLPIDEIHAGENVNSVRASLLNDGRVNVTVAVIGREEDNDDNDERYEYEGDIRDYKYIVSDEPGAGRLRTAIWNDGALRELYALAEERRKFEEGERPLWHLTQEPADVESLRRQASEAADRARYLLSGAQASDDFNAVLALVDEKIASGGFRGDERAAAWNQTLNLRAFAFGVGERLRVTDVVDSELKFREAAVEAEKFERAIAEAKELPEGPLKEFLIGERPQRFYETTEGVGRKKRTVRKPYTPTSDLVKDHDMAVTRLKRAAEDRTERREFIENARRAHQEATGDYLVAYAESEKARVAYESFGWPGEPSVIPSRGSSAPGW